ncbi:hypothetical protein G4X40_04860 [Rhodococcus sp. D2-41]|nr:hypothetical protein [Rhodococcus sp. D2-41]
MPPAPKPPVVDAKTLWAGGCAAAVVAALIVVLGLLVVRGLLDTPVISPLGTNYSQAATLAGYAAAAALVATALLHLLLVSTPTAMSFFNWICTLATIIAAVLPFAQYGSTASKVASAIVYLIVGFAITSLLDGVATSARRKAATRQPRR